jgi:hypothetical protein
MASPNCKTEAEDYNWIQTGAKDFESNCKQAQTHASYLGPRHRPKDATTKKMTNSTAELVSPRVAGLFSPA